MSNPIKILCIHGVGGHPVGGAWEREWLESIQQSIHTTDSSIQVECIFVHYDDILKKRKISWYDVIDAIGKLAGNGIGSIFRGQARGSKGVKGLGTKIKYTAGMVIKWVEDDSFREETRKRLADAIKTEQPDIICAHSMGSLVAYDCFTHTETKTLIKDIIFITFGSQISNPFIQGTFSGGKISNIEGAKFWFHLYNKHDDVFACPIKLQRPNFSQIEAHFDNPGMADHSATSYLSHENTVDSVWAEIALAQNNSAEFALRPIPIKSKRKNHKWAMPKKHRALLIGINDYPDEGMRLDGCVNDVFLMSSMLQELGIDPENIRVVLDKRATADAIKERLEWLLDGCEDGDNRILYFSGHGAQIPGYGIGEVIDRKDESLVPWDFDWSREKAIVDDDFYELYSQLDYNTQFTSIFDCCHSAGMTRNGSQKVRGINPPDDIRHRAMKFTHNSWDSREILHDLSSEEIVQSLNKESKPPSQFLNELATHKLGQARALRTCSEEKEFKLKAQKMGHSGPYMPTMMYACSEHEYAYEYRHGSVSYGAFTYSLVQHIRALKQGNKTESPAKIINAVKVAVQSLRFPQEPKLIAPSAVRDKPVKWITKS